jgi:coenzyme F420 hydrogenase subunit beta
MSILSVPEAGLCVQCGTCAAVCPTAAIRMVWDGRRGYDLGVAPDLCNDCGLCEKVCPGPAVDFRRLSGEFLDGQNDDARLGCFRSCYTGHAKDEVVRWDAASGGIVTALLVAGLREGAFDGALVTRMNPESPLQPMPILAKTEEEIRAATGSKYCPVAANLRLREILEADGRFAVVGLPCHIHGLRMAQARMPKLRQKVAVGIALFCGLNMRPLGTTFALQRRQVPIDQVVALRYRGEGWPGYFQAQKKDGQVYREQLFSYFDDQFSAYEMYRCSLCSDAFGELADLSCGDAWLPEYRANDDKGTSVVIVRDTRGEDLLASVGQAALDLAPVTAGTVARSQKNALLWKKDWLQAKISLARLAGRQTPTYEQDLPRASVGAYMGASGRIATRFFYRQWHRVRGFDRSPH